MQVCYRYICCFCCPHYQCSSMNKKAQAGQGKRQPGRPFLFADKKVKERYHSKEIYTKGSLKKNDIYHVQTV